MAIWGIVVNIVVKNVSQLFKKKEDRKFGLGIGDYEHMNTVKNGIANPNLKKTVIEPLSQNAIDEFRDARSGVKNSSGLGSSVLPSPTPFMTSSPFLASAGKSVSLQIDNRPDPDRSMLVVSVAVLGFIILVYVNS